MTKRNKIGSLTILLPYILRYRRLAFGALIALIVAAVVMLALPIAMRRMFDHGFSRTDSSLINAYFAVLLVLACCLSLASASRYYCIITMGEKIVNDLRRDVFAHLVTLCADFYDKNHSGEITSRLASDTTQIKSAVGAALSIALRNFIMVIGSLCMMVLTSAKLSILVLSTLPLILLPILIMGRKVRLSSRLAQDMLANANALAGEQIANIRNVQAFNAQNFIVTNFYKLCADAMRALRHSIQARAWLTGMAIFLIFSCVVAILWIGAHDVLAGHMSTGTLGQFVLYAVFAASSFSQLSEVASELAQTAGAAGRLSELLACQPTIKSPRHPIFLPQPVQGAIHFHNVSFSYPTRKNYPSLQELNFSIKPGETVAFVGSSGAGKSTIFSLLLRFYDPLKGKICLDGQILSDLDLHYLRSKIAYVPQESAIFAGSLRDNICFGIENIDAATIDTAIEAAQLGEFVTTLPQGLETLIGERGLTLSGGQRQRIAIARALVRDCPILLLDEATSALDAQSETLIQQAFDTIRQGRTTLVIAHRLATVLKADRIIVLDSGSIIEEGSHHKLLSTKGTYARLAALQFVSHHTI